MTNYEALVAEGDRLREHYRSHKDIDEAIEKYKQALTIGGSRDHHCRQMIGVCYQIKCDYAAAMVWYREALVGASEFETGNIYRDMAESESGRNNHDLALRWLGESLGRLPIEEYPEEHAATLGFMARVYQRRGDLELAIPYFGLASVLLGLGRNRKIELYTKLHYANALSEGGQWLKSRSVALAAAKLSRRYGGRAHKGRAVILLIGGHRLDNFVRAKRHR